MKKTIVTMALLVVALGAMAQDGEGRKGKRGHMADLTPEQIATLHTKKMTLALDLTQAQQTEVKQLLLEKAEERKAKMAERKAKKEDGAKPTDEEKYAMMNERLDRQLEHQEKMKGILTEKQYENWKNIQLDKRGKRGCKGKKGKKKEAREEHGRE